MGFQIVHVHLTVTCKLVIWLQKNAVFPGLAKGFFAWAHFYNLSS